MKRLPKLAALCAVFLLTCCLCAPVALAVEEPQPHTPAIATTESAIPAGDEAVPPTEEADEGEAVADPTEETGGREAVDIPPDVAEAAGIDPTPPAGTGTVIETATGEDGREFYTITTPAGNVFYLIIDFTRQAENVYFLDAVTERDLLALAETSGDTGLTEAEGAGAAPETAGPEPSAAPEPEAGAANGGDMTNIILIIVVVAGIGGAGFYFKVYRRKKDADIRDEYETDEYEPDEPDNSAGDGYEADGQEYDYGDYEENQEDDSPPWDEEDQDDEDGGGDREDEETDEPEESIEEQEDEQE